MRRGLNRRTFIRTLCGVLTGNAAGLALSADLLASAGPCQASSTRPLRWIIPNALGGSSDTFTRMLQPFLEERLGLTIQPVNVPGASGIVGARQLQSAVPDGMTLGILSAPGLLTAHLMRNPGCPDPLSDFDILCRISRSRHVWATGRHSGIQDFADVLAISRRRPLVFGLNNVGGVSFIDATVASALLGIRIVFVPGYRGSRETSLAAIRGDVDLVALSWESLIDRIETGDLKPLLLIDDRPVASETILEDVPLLGGPHGILATGRIEGRTDPGLLAEDGRALIRLIGSGRVIAGPRGMKNMLLDCLEARLLAALRDPAFLSVAARGDRTVDIAPGDEARSDILAARARIDRFIPILEEALDRVRGRAPADRGKG